MKNVCFLFLMNNKKKKIYNNQYNNKIKKFKIKNKN